MKKNTSSFYLKLYTRWFIPVALALCEAEAKGSKIETPSGQLSKTTSKF